MIAVCENLNLVPNILEIQRQSGHKIAGIINSIIYGEDGGTEQYKGLKFLLKVRFCENCYKTGGLVSNSFQVVCTPGKF